MIRHVLAATDFSPLSGHAVDRALALASAAGARCTVLHAVGLEAGALWRGVLGLDADAIAARVVENARARLQEFVQVPARDHGLAPHLVVDEGPATSAIPARTSELDADLVVVGARGAGNLRRLLVGSTTSRLLRKSDRPVLVVKTPWQGSYRRAVAAVDFSPASTATLGLARAIAPGAHVELLHILDTPYEALLATAGVAPEAIHAFHVQARQRALEQLHALGTSAGLDRDDRTVSVGHGEAAAAILERVRRSHAELVVMGKHGTHVTEELLLGSVTRRVLGECVADLLMVVDSRLSAQE